MHALSLSLSAIFSHASLASLCLPPCIIIVIRRRSQYDTLADDDDGADPGNKTSQERETGNAASHARSSLKTACIALSFSLLVAQVSSGLNIETGGGMAHTLTDG